MSRPVSWAAVLSALLALSVLDIRVARSGDVLAEISVRNARLENQYYGKMFVFPDRVRDYSARNLFGYSFREDLPGGAVRMLEIARVRTSGAYVMATDLFANGRFSTMSHTVLMVFPRVRHGAEAYEIAQDTAGDYQILAPDGSVLWIDGRTGSMRRSRDFALAPQGAPGTPPGLAHRGLHLEIHAVGKNPFLQGTPVVIEDATGAACRLSTDELFAYDGRLESDVFRFDSDDELFSYLDARCPGLRLPAIAAQPVAAIAAVALTPPASASVPILQPVAAVDSAFQEPQVSGLISVFAGVLTGRLW
jgi:hypothetical protein